MDQFAEACGVAGAAVLLDCRSLEWRAVPLPDDIRIVVLHTGSKRHLDGSEYNVRRSQCEAAVAAIAKDDPAVTSLRDVTRFHLSAARTRMDAVAYRRAEHVVTENQRVAETVAALESGDLAEVGRRVRGQPRVAARAVRGRLARARRHGRDRDRGPGRGGRADDRRRLRGLHGQPRPARGRSRRCGPPWSATTRPGPGCNRWSCRCTRWPAPADCADRDPPHPRSPARPGTRCPAMNARLAASLTGSRASRDPQIASAGPHPSTGVRSP